MMNLSLFSPLRFHKYLMYQLTQREIKARYKQSFIGYAWVLVNPLAQMLIYTFVFSVVFRFNTNDIPYPIFLFAALLPWNTLQGSITHATMSLVENSVLLRKVAFPREIIPYSVVIAKIIDFLFASLVFIALLLFYGTPLAATSWLFIPLFLVQLVLTTGISLLLSMFNLFYRDIQYVTGLLLMIWMYLTPVVYPLSLVPNEYVWLYKLNPMVGLIEGYRAALFGTPFEPTIIWWSVGISFVTSAISFIIVDLPAPLWPMMPTVSPA